MKQGMEVATKLGEKVLKKTDPKVVFFTAATTTLILMVLYIFLTWSVGFTSSVDFCTVNCHEMAVSFREWQTSSHYNNATGIVAECADCHLPRGFIPKIKAKLYFGIKDTWVHYLGDPDNLDRKHLAESAVARITDDSCTACHKNLFPSGLPRGGYLAHSSYLDGEQGKCVNCHRQMVHQNRIYFD
jgi:cytochrome c-type protein NapC/trimethylamine-N-oxide reductase cytochrome c-type subunit TorC